MGTGELTFNAAPNFESPTDADADNVYEVTVEVEDGNGGTDSQTIAVTVTNVNEDPEITSSPTVSVAENQNSVLIVSSADVDGDTPEYSIFGGADATLFSIDSGTGVLSFNAAPNFEAPEDVGADNVYNVIVEVDDGNGGTDTQDIAVTVANVNDDPVITSTSFVSTAENQPTVLTVTSTDEDGGTCLLYTSDAADE